MCPSIPESSQGLPEKLEHQLSSGIIKPIEDTMLVSIVGRLVSLEEKVSDMEEILDLQVPNLSDKEMT